MGTFASFRGVWWWKTYYGVRVKEGWSRLSWGSSGNPVIQWVQGRGMMAGELLVPPLSLGLQTQRHAAVNAAEPAPSLLRMDLAP